MGNQLQKLLRYCSDQCCAPNRNADPAFEYANFGQHLSVVGKRIRYGVLGMTLLSVSGAFAYSANSSLPRLGCPILHFTGIPCPTCGMTRSFIAIAQGDLGSAITYHLLGPLVFLSFVVAALHVFLELVFNRQWKTFYTQLLTSYVSFWSVLILFLSYHSYRLLQLAVDGSLITSFAHSPLSQLLQSL